MVLGSWCTGYWSTSRGGFIVVQQASELDAVVLRSWCTSRGGWSANNGNWSSTRCCTSFLSMAACDGGHHGDDCEANHGGKLPGVAFFSDGLSESRNLVKLSRPCRLRMRNKLGQTGSLDGIGNSVEILRTIVQRFFSDCRRIFFPICPNPLFLWFKNRVYEILPALCPGSDRGSGPRLHGLRDLPVNIR